MFSYDVNLASDKDKVRFYIDDRDPAAQQFADEEIAALLLVQSNPLLCAAGMARTISARYSTKVAISIDGYSVQYGQMAENYAALADRLEGAAARGTGALGLPFVGGISRGEMDGVDQNNDRQPSQFAVGMDDNPRGPTDPRISRVGS